MNGGLCMILINRAKANREYDVTVLSRAYGLIVVWIWYVMHRSGCNRAKFTLEIRTIAIYCAVCNHVRFTLEFHTIVIYSTGVQVEQGLYRNLVVFLL